MRVLTVRQPWAWSIIHGGKDVENRSRNIAGDYRGPIAIHVGLQFAVAAQPLDMQVAKAIGETSRAGRSGLGRVPSRITDPDEPRHHVGQWFGHRGAVIGVVDLVDVHVHREGPQCHRPADMLGWVRYDGGTEPEPVTCSAWGMAGHHHLVLANPRPLATPIAATGRLGLWRPDDDLQAAVWEQLPA